jgi:hypothetical protein
MREQMIFENDKGILAELSFRRRKVVENLEKTYPVKILILSITCLTVIICKNMFLPNYLQFFYKSTQI